MHPSVGAKLALGLIGQGGMGQNKRALQSVEECRQGQGMGEGSLVS